MEQSALPRKVKMASLTQTVIRMCTNQVGRNSKELKNIHLKKLMYKMKVSGCSQEKRREVMIAGLRGYSRMEKDHRPINRPGWMGQKTRRLKKLTGKNIWYKKPKNEKKIETTKKVLGRINGGLMLRR